MPQTATFLYLLRDKFSSKLRRITANVKRFSTAAKFAAGNAQLLGRKMMSIGRASVNMGRTMMMRTTLPIIAGAALATKAYANLESGMIRITNLLTRGEAKQWAAPLTKLRNEAVRAGVDIADANKGLYDTISAMGMGKPKRALDTFKSAQILSVAGFASMEASVDGMTTVMNLWKNAIPMEVATAFFSAQVKGKVTVQQLTESIRKLAPVMKTAGLSYQEMMAGVAATTVSGLAPDMAGVAMRQFLFAIIKPAKGAREAMEALNKQGYDLAIGAEQVRGKGLARTLRGYYTLAKEKGGVDKLARAIPNIRAFLQAVSTTEFSLQKFDETVKKISSDMLTGDGLLRGYSEQLASMERTGLRLKNAWLLMSSSFIQVFEKDMKRIGNYFIDLLEHWENLTDGSKKFWAIGLLILAVLPLLLMGFGFLTMGIAGFAISLGVTALALSFITAPMVFFATLIGTLITVLVGAYINSSKFRESLVHLGEAIKPLWDALKGLVFLIAVGLSKAFGGAGEEFKDFGDIAAFVINGIAYAVKGLTVMLFRLGEALGALSAGHIGDAWKILKGEIGTMSGDYLRTYMGDDYSGIAQRKAGFNNRFNFDGSIRVSASEGSQIDNANIGLQTGDQFLNMMATGRY